MNRALIAQQLWQQLWSDYSRRVEYARVYQRMIETAGGTIANDHIAFRSLRLTLDTPNGDINLGIPYLANLFEVLGYEAVGDYEFPDQHLFARHYQYAGPEAGKLPKLFISELVVDELPEVIAPLIKQAVQSGQYCDTKHLHQLDRDPFVAQIQSCLTRPWPPPKQSIVQQVNAVSQYGAWVLLHGYAVNHFTGYINRQHTPQYSDLASTAQALAALGVPMKADIEGSHETGLQQTATQAVTELVAVTDDTGDRTFQIPWTYAYYELAERHHITTEAGQPALFEGFLTNQARQLFEMTKKE